MGLTINTNVAAMNAHQNLAAHMAQADGAAAPGKASIARSGGDSLDIAAANQAAAQSTVSTAALAAQVASMTQSQIADSPDGAISAQGGVRPESVLSLLQ